MGWRADGGSISGDMLQALGKGFLIACAGLAVGAIFGGASAVAGGLWAIAATGLAGAACMLGSSAFHRQCLQAKEAREYEARQTAEVLEVAKSLPGTGLATPEECEPRFVAMLERERCQGAGKGV